MALTSEKPWRATKKSKFCQYYKTYSRTAHFVEIVNMYIIEMGCFVHYFRVNRFILKISQSRIIYAFKRIKRENHMYAGCKGLVAVRYNKQFYTFM